jgi:hypothetical protein
MVNPKQSLRAKQTEKNNYFIFGNFFRWIIKIHVIAECIVFIFFECNCHI